MRFNHSHGATSAGKNSANRASDAGSSNNSAAFTARDDAHATYLGNAQSRAQTEAPVTPAECHAAEAECFLDRVFDGSLSPMLAHFSSARRLRKTELNELENLLRTLRRK